MKFLENVCIRFLEYRRRQKYKKYKMGYLGDPDTLVGVIGGFSIGSEVE